MDSEKISDKQEFFVYLVTCVYKDDIFIKIGRTNDIRRRKREIQVGCPHKIKDIFIISSDFEEEIIGLEEILKILFPKPINGEWYLGSRDFFHGLGFLLELINLGVGDNDFLEKYGDFLSTEAWEIALHLHRFSFYAICFRKSEKIIERQVSSAEMFHIIRNAHKNFKEGFKENPSV